MVKVKNAMSELKLPRRVGTSYFYSVPPELKEQYPENILLQVHPFRAYKMCESALGFSDRSLAEALGVLLDGNRKLVSGGGEPRIVLEQLIIKIAGRGKA